MHYTAVFLVHKARKLKCKGKGGNSFMFLFCVSFLGVLPSEG